MAVWLRTLRSKHQGFQSRNSGIHRRLHSPQTTKLHFGSSPTGQILAPASALVSSSTKPTAEATLSVCPLNLAEGLYPITATRLAGLLKQQKETKENGSSAEDTRNLEIFAETQRRPARSRPLRTLKIAYRAADAKDNERTSAMPANKKNQIIKRFMEALKDPKTRKTAEKRIRELDRTPDSNPAEAEDEQ